MSTSRYEINSWLTLYRKLDRFRKIKAKTEIPPAKDNPLIFAFWTCLQLERYELYLLVKDKLTRTVTLSRNYPALIRVFSHTKKICQVRICKQRVMSMASIRESSRAIVRNCFCESISISFIICSTNLMASSLECGFAELSNH